jgi:lipopolysaccharide biosynthesis glycosyltransferase
MPKRNGMTATHIIIATLGLAMILMWACNFHVMQSIQPDHPKKLSSSKITNTKGLQSFDPKGKIETESVSPNGVDKGTRDHQKSPYSYAWVLGGVHEDKWAYRGFLWNIIISANLLRKLGSTADLWIFVRLSPESKLDVLPPEDQRLLEAVGINIKILDKPKKESFAQIVFDKFLTINMTDYRRVIFLDGDLIPLSNMDYMFHLSDPEHTETPTLIKPNLITASFREPCNTGIFMVEPSVEAFAKYNDAMSKQKERAKSLPYPHFNYEEGWGRNFKKHHEHWRSVTKKATRWHFHASHSDQGLMYYWSKYLMQEVTIVIGEFVENWKPGLDGEPLMESEVKDVFAPFQSKPPLVWQDSCDKLYEERKPDDQKMHWRCYAPFNTYSHFMGKTKPWKQKFYIHDNFTEYLSYSYRQRAPLTLWFKELIDINEKLKMGLDTYNWNDKYPVLLNTDTLGQLARFTDQEDVLDLNSDVESGVENGTEEISQIGDATDKSNVVPSNEKDQGKADGNLVDKADGELVGETNGDDDGNLVGKAGGELVRETDGNADGKLVGDANGEPVGANDGDLVGKANGDLVGDTEGEAEGDLVGKADGEADGNLKNPVIAYAVSFIKCGDHQNNAAGLIDASLVLRHSIHKISSRNPDSGSKYDYKMYAIVHSQAQECTQVLEKSGFEVVVVDPPFDKSEIKGDFLRTHIHKERCCGHDEFIKLQAYKLPEDVIVHVDIDFAFYKPMDHLFDAIIYEKDSSIGQAARKTLQLERPGDALPDKIGAFLTRDWPQVVPGKWPAGYQAGFLVARRDPSIAYEMVDVIKEGNYTDGWGYGYGWGNKGYGGWVGAMAMQGLVAYYYDHVRPNNAVELNHCKYNHMGMDVRHRGQCRNGLDTCEDCMKTKMEDVHSMHYTMCRKPWLCQAIGARGGKKPGGGRGSALNTDSVNVDHCLEMAQQWHNIRSDLEASLLKLTNDESIKKGASGTYKPDVFQGHCDGDGDEHYLKIAGSEESLGRIQELYNANAKTK